ncbi:MAG: hypothetical protein ACLP81_02005, partial [Acidimicrobiales bacterium]
MATGVVERRPVTRPARRRDGSDRARLRLVGGTTPERGEPDEKATTEPKRPVVRRLTTTAAARRDAAALTALVLAFCVFGLIVVLSASSVESIAA